MISTSRHMIVDEVYEVLINGETFSIRIIEDSYGPMRILKPQSHVNMGRDVVDSSSDEEGEYITQDDDRFEFGNDDADEEREPAMENENSMALIVHPNSHGRRNKGSAPFLDVSIEGEDIQGTICPHSNCNECPFRRESPTINEDRVFLEANQIVCEEEEGEQKIGGPRENGPVISPVVSSTREISEEGGENSVSASRERLGRAGPSVAAGSEQLLAVGGAGSKQGGAICRKLGGEISVLASRERLGRAGPSVAVGSEQLLDAGGAGNKQGGAISRKLVISSYRLSKGSGGVKKQRKGEVNVKPGPTRIPIVPRNSSRDNIAFSNTGGRTYITHQANSPASSLVDKKEICTENPVGKFKPKKT